MEHVVVPRIQEYIQFIKKVLDEQAREDFFRLKKLTDKKKKLKEMAIRMKEKKDSKGEGKDEEEGEDIIPDEADSAVAGFGKEAGDEDIIF